MPGLTVVAEMIAMIGASAQRAAGDIKEATAAQREYNETKAAGTTSGMEQAAGGGPSTMGSSAAGPVDTNGLGAALQVTRGRL